MLNIVIPMAGLGSRFVSAGYDMPKPLISVHNKLMIEVVVRNLSPTRAHRFIFICRNQHLREYDLAATLRACTENPVIIGIDELTEGQACSVLLAKEYINNDNPLMTANSDQFVDIAIDDYLRDMDERGLDGFIMTMKASGPKWSYAQINDAGYVTKTAEKVEISSHGTVGVYNFRHGRDFVAATEKMIAQNLRVNNEFYICPCYNQLVAEGKKIGIHPIGDDRQGMYGLGVPEDLEFFLQHPISRQFI